MTKRWMATIGLAAVLTAGGTLVTAVPAGADPSNGCPMLETENGGSQWFGNASDEAVRSRLIACKRMGVF